MRDLITSLALFVLLVLVVNPLHFWMPTTAHMLILAGLVAVFGLLVVYVMREETGDEREQEHRARAGRMAFLSGAGVLIVGIIAQSLSGPVDPWLAIALIAMVGTKIIVRWYSDSHL